MMCPASSQVIGVLFAAVAAIGVLAVAAALLPSARLATAVMLFVLVQRVAAIGASGSSSLGLPALSTFFAYLNLVNFNVEVRHKHSACNSVGSVGHLGTLFLQVC